MSAVDMTLTGGKLTLNNVNSFLDFNETKANRLTLQAESRYLHSRSSESMGFLLQYRPRVHCGSDVYSVKRRREVWNKFIDMRLSSSIYINHGRIGKCRDVI